MISSAIRADVRAMNLDDITRMYDLLKSRVSELESAEAQAFTPGMAVSFKGKNNRTVTGIIDKCIRRGCGFHIRHCSDGMVWNVNASSLTAIPDSALSPSIVKR